MSQASQQEEEIKNDQLAEFKNRIDDNQFKDAIDLL
jgi:hypothetical protein